MACLALLAALGAAAQYADYSKMSPMVRQLAVGNRTAMRRAPGALPDSRPLCAFVQVADEDRGEEMLKAQGCRPLAQLGDIFIASIPVGRLAALSLHPQVTRIEARQRHSLHMDTTVVLLGGSRVHLGDGLPQAFTGSGVVVGVEDIGFDLTHPNFYDRSLSEYRIKRLWDFLAVAEHGSDLYVGADFTDEAALKAYGRTRDATIISHGTHTAGTAAGSGYDTPYVGMAPGSDLCLVSNAVSEDAVLIDSADTYKFTYSTDVLGFKYIFDYADAVGKPCVVSFSEGSAMDFRGDDVLYYEAIGRLLGPGHILVASAGNDGLQVTHVCKPAAVEQTSVALSADGIATYFAVKGSSDDYSILLHFKGPEGASATRALSVPDVYALADSVYTDTLDVAGVPYYITASAYPNCFNERQNVIEVVLMSSQRIGAEQKVSVDIVGEGCLVELFRGIGYLVPSDPQFGDCAYSVHSPSSAPSVISVGATGYRTGFTNYQGLPVTFNMGTDGQRSGYSSAGPSFDGRVKPDVMAPGTNIISSYSSYYLEARPDASDINSDVEHFDFQGRTYAWNANSGTSMSTPVVAGTIALWLQANPRLSPSDVMDVIAATSRRHDASMSYPNNLYGYGEIDAYAGLLHVLNMSGIEGLSTRQPAAVKFALQGPVLTVRMDSHGDRSVAVRLYATSGTMVRQLQAVPHNGALAVSLHDLPHGVYAVQVDGHDAATTGSTLIRWQ